MTAAAPDPIYLARMRWQCRRGMRELDVLLMRYFEEHYPHATPTQQQSFAALLELQDPVILAYLTGAATPDQPEIADVIQQLTRIGA